MFDCHLHTTFSTDSTMDINNAISKANSIGIGIIITEHMDIDYPVPGNFLFDPEEYFRKYAKLRNDKLLLGIEMGMQPCCLDKNREIAQSSPFDFIIGSIHVVDGCDLFWEKFYNGRSKKDAYMHYLNKMLECVKSHDFIDSLGHIDYISRYATYDDPEIYYEDYNDVIDEILKVIIERDRAIELNTRRLSDTGAAANLTTIFKRYNELGGKIATIGSDSHNTDSIGKEFKTAAGILDKCNIKPVYFKERKPQYIK